MNLNLNVSSEQYADICTDTRVALDLSAEEAAAILAAYDYGVSKLNAKDLQRLDAVVAKLKAEIWP